MPNSHLTRPVRWAAALASALAVLALAGCSSGSSSSSGSSAQKAAPFASGTDEGSSSGSKAAAASTRTRAQRQAVVKTGQIALTSKDLPAVRAKVDALLASVGGTLDDEHTTTDRAGRAKRSTLTLRVPVRQFARVMDTLQRLGHLRSSSQSARDVTTQVIDTTQRVRTLRTSLERLQTFQSKATDARDLIRYEEDISQRQADLQSLTAQKSYLADQTSMSTITLQMSTPSAAPAPTVHSTGFLPGLRGGWHGLVSSVGVVLTVLGAALPFLVLAALLGVPVWMIRRARRPANPDSSATAPRARPDGPQTNRG